MRVEVGRKRRELGTAEKAPVVPKAQRREVWAGWLAEGRYRSLRELAEARGSALGA